MTDQTTETARALLYRYGLPEDVIDGVLCLHARELAAEIREETRQLKEHGVLEPWKYRPCRDAANQIDPTRNEDDVDPDEAGAPLPPADQTALRDRITDGQGEPVELRGLPREVRLLVHSIDRMRREWAEMPEHGPERRGLWTEVHSACEAVWNRPLAVLPAPVDRATVLREAADQYAKLTDQNEAYDREHGELDEEARLRHEVVRDVVAGLRRMADETAATETHPPADAGLPAGTLEAAEIGANRLDTWARSPQGRNFLAHALVQLARTGWLRPAPGEPFEPKREDAPPAEPVVTMHAIPLPGSNGVSACCGRPPCEFVGERVTRDPDKVTCTGAAAGVRQDGAPS
ncbi:hypothetical protein [Streptomyces rubrogriseus]|uniref:hypothetical protein n=1 Tax=Streptomyces rubrogriseus TaxID=194673 RepID=UPI000D597A56|nr:hypothetical protein [Streptomyces rubrogriseus]